MLKTLKPEYADHPDFIHKAYGRESARGIYVSHNTEHNNSVVLRDELAVVSKKSLKYVITSPIPTSS